MQLFSVLFALLPIVVIFLLLVSRRLAADWVGVIGWTVALGVAWLYFGTPLPVGLQASLAGIVASLPITLVVGASILQVTLMAETGALARIVALIKTVAPGQRAVQIMLINVGFGTLLTTLGAVPVSILPPIMLALGYTSFTAIALPALGYDALCNEPPTANGGLSKKRGCGYRSRDFPIAVGTPTKKSPLSLPLPEEKGGPDGKTVPYAFPPRYSMKWIANAIPL